MFLEKLFLFSSFSEFYGTGATSQPCGYYRYTSANTYDFYLSYCSFFNYYLNEKGAVVGLDNFPNANVLIEYCLFYYCRVYGNSIAAISVNKVEGFVINNCCGSKCSTDDDESTGNGQFLMILSYKIMKSISVSVTRCPVLESFYRKNTFSLILFPQVSGSNILSVKNCNFSENYNSKSNNAFQFAITSFPSGSTYSIEINYKDRKSVV